MTIGYMSRPRRGPKPQPRKATTVRYTLDIWHKFKNYCDQEGVSTGDAQNALLTWYVTERAAGRPVPSLCLDKAILPQQEPASEAPPKDPWFVAMDQLKAFLSESDFALLKNLELKQIERGKDYIAGITSRVVDAIVYVDTREHGQEIDRRGLREQLRAALAGATGEPELKVLFVARRKGSPPVSSPAQEIAAPPVVVPTPAPLPVEIPPAPLLPRLIEGFDDPDCLHRIYQARRGLFALGVLTEVDAEIKRLNKNCSLGGVVEHYETKLKMHQEARAPQQSLSLDSPKEKATPAPDLADKIASQLRDLYQRSLVAAKENKHGEAAKLGQQAALLVSGCEQATLDIMLHRNPTHARLWWGWIESNNKKQAAEAVYQSSKRR